MFFLKYILPVAFRSVIPESRYRKDSEKGNYFRLRFFF